MADNSKRFFCHKCVVEIPSVTEDLSCPTCDNGFVEELGGEEQSPPRAGPRQEETLPHNNDQEPRIPRNRMRGPVVRPIHHRRRNRRAGDITLILRGNNGGSLGRRRMRLSLGHQIMQNLFINGPGFNFRPAEGVIPSLGLGESIGLEDYVFGSSSHLNAIINRLMEDSDQERGVPGMEKDKIDSIPTVLLTYQQKEKNRDCCVCWEDLDGEVRLLECGHCFHSQCIVPWLHLHATCPMCRKLLANSTTNTRSFTEPSPSSTSNVSPSFTTASIASSTTTSSSTSIWTMDREMTEGTSLDVSSHEGISTMNTDTRDHTTARFPSTVTSKEVSFSGESKTHSIVEESQDISSSVINTSSFNSVISETGTNVPVQSTSYSPDGIGQLDEGSASKKPKLDS